MVAEEAGPLKISKLQRQSTIARQVLEETNSNVAEIPNTFLVLATVKCVEEPLSTLLAGTNSVGEGP